MSGQSPPPLPPQRSKAAAPSNNEQLVNKNVSELGESDLFYRYPGAAPAAEPAAEPAEPAEEKPRITAVDLEQEIERLREEGIVTAAEAQWLKAVFLEFGLLPHDLVDFKRKGLLERMGVLERARIDIVRVRERWVREWQLDPEKAAAKKPPAGYVAEYIAARAVELGLVEPVVMMVGETTEFGVKVGRRVYFENDLKSVAYKLAGAGAPHYHVNQLHGAILAALRARAKPLPRELVDPPHLLNTRSGAVDLERFEIVDTEAVFTYELPEVTPVFLEWVRKGVIEEEYFVGQAFYRILREHYAKEEWEKLKAVLGATIAPRTLKLIAVIVGEKSTRKTFLNELLSRTLGSLAAPVKLRQLEGRFALQHALGARVLLTSEEAQTIVYNIDVLKIISGGDPLFIDRKHLPPVVRKDNPLKIIIFSNALPVFKNFDDALVDRLVIIQTENPKVPDAEELALEEKAKADAEAFFEFILWCFWQLRKNNYMIPGKGDPAYAELLVERQSNVYVFLKELESGLELKGRKYTVFFGQGAKTDAARLYDVYVEWCVSKGEKYVGRNSFYQFVEGAWSKEGVIKVRAKEGMVFRGVHLQEKDVNSVELDSI